MENKCNHKVVNLPYLASFEDADKRMAKGEKQVECPVCNLFIWETHYNDYKKKREPLITVYILSDNFGMSGWYHDSMNAVADVIEGMVADMTIKEKKEIQYIIDVKRIKRSEYENLPDYEF